MNLYFFKVIFLKLFFQLWNNFEVMKFFWGYEIFKFIFFGIFNIKILFETCKHYLQSAKRMFLEVLKVFYVKLVHISCIGFYEHQLLPTKFPIFVKTFQYFIS